MLLRVGLYPQETHEGDKPYFSSEEIDKLKTRGAVLEADGYHYAYTFQVASALYKYVNDHYTLDLWSQAVSRNKIQEDERVEIDLKTLEKLAKKPVDVPKQPKKTTINMRGQTTLG